MARGRPPTHTREQVVDAAVALADAEGLGAVTIRRVAAEVGAGTMSLYTYVRDKDRLVDLMVDRVGGTRARLRATGDWHADLLALVSAQRDLMLRHPWLPAALPNRPLTGAAALGHLEDGLAALAPTALTATAKMEVLGLLTGFVATYVTHEIAVADAGTTPPEQQEERVAELRAAVATGAYPHLAAALAAPPDPAATPDFGRIAARMVTGLVTAFG